MVIEDAFKFVINRLNSLLYKKDRKKVSALFTLNFELRDFQGINYAEILVIV